MYVLVEMPVLGIKYYNFCKRKNHHTHVFGGVEHQSVYFDSFFFCEENVLVIIMQIIRKEASYDMYDAGERERERERERRERERVLI